MTQVYTFLSIFIISLISLIGILALVKGIQLRKGTLTFLVALSVGSLLGGAAFHLLPETFEHAHGNKASRLLVLGFVLFFIVEKALHWRNKHKNNVEGVKAFGSINLASDFLHNFIDGIIIAIAYRIDIHAGVAATIGVALHEIPQELGDFGVLLKAGFSAKKALLFNFLSALGAMLGAAIIIFLPLDSHTILDVLLPICVAGFLYLALANLVPTLNSESSIKKIVVQFVGLIIGVSLVWTFQLIEFSSHSH